MPDKTPYSFRNYKVLSNKIYLLEPLPHELSKQQTTTSPTTIIIFAWGDGHPKHVAKYADGYRALYPTSRIIVVLCTLMESMLQSISAHSKSMQPVVEAVFPSLKTNTTPNTDENRILVQIMSNSGAVSFIATILAYKAMRQEKGMGEDLPEMFPHTLLVCDSTPGGLHFWPNISRWSKALSLATPIWVPIPVILVRALWSIFLIAVQGVSWFTGWHKTQIGRTLAEGIKDPELMSTKAKRLYLYSKGDELVRWEDVEEHVAVARERGYDCEMERFEKSEHVGHMRMYGEMYWGAIAKAWEDAVGEN